MFCCYGCTITWNVFIAINDTNLSICPIVLSIPMLRVFPVRCLFVGIGNLNGRGSSEGGLQEKTGKALLRPPTSQFRNDIRNPHGNIQKVVKTIEMRHTKFL